SGYSLVFRPRGPQSDILRSASARLEGSAPEGEHQGAGGAVPDVREPPGGSVPRPGRGSNQGPSSSAAMTLPSPRIAVAPIVSRATVLRMTRRAPAAQAAWPEASSSECCPPIAARIPDITLAID